MTQADLNRAVARATGESVAEIARFGFVPLSRRPEEYDPESLDWDEVQQERRIAVFEQRRRGAAA